MDIALGAAALLAFASRLADPALLLRSGLDACQRFSPRAALALSALGALCSSLLALYPQSRALHLPVRQGTLVVCALTGGTLGRALLLMFVARFSGSLALSRLHALPLLCLCILTLFPPRHTALKARAYGLLCFFCALLEGFLGCGGMPIFSAFTPTGALRRGHVSTRALLLRACAQSAALLLTLCVGAAQTFPPRMLLLLMLGAALGAQLSLPNGAKKRGTLPAGIRTALKVYLLFSTLSIIEQAI